MTLSVEQRVHSEAQQLSVAAVAGTLQEVLGQRLTAVIAGVHDAKAVGKWARGERQPQPDTERHLRDAFQITQLLLTAEQPTTVRAWFTGMNPLLDDHAPALLIQDDPVQALRAARAFLAHG